ncbi:uncharacterized protein LACBIDRAFT_331137 [Laccaria bicolor S238N-H82]|uniref:Predicted protein n=1 Tax=Laccaria bicolor (strain S238N-H82 / ATCC MYA-4686) TaxID=486041 RepID=B0DNK8_LACBS|nr:uncharacterized protein LACBIDRAFT_331137 [Laccaria bicolor S238N-H82]EDR03883.1 predicted protein [Laccaria bicolor S238N-H82]|eukprot:XP_001885451.1 predicted protein [Laccaria bicolor S238N-H82]
MYIPTKSTQSTPISSTDTDGGCTSEDYLVQYLIDGELGGSKGTSANHSTVVAVLVLDGRMSEMVYDGPMAEMAAQGSAQCTTQEHWFGCEKGSGQIQEVPANTNSRAQAQEMSYEEKAKGMEEEAVAINDGEDVSFEFSSDTMNKTSSLLSSGSTSHMFRRVVAIVEAFGLGNLDGE